MSGENEKSPERVPAPASEPIAERLVEVAVSLPISGTFTYRVPANLRDDVDVGARVTVPFGARKINGYILALDVPAPEDARARSALKDIVTVFEDRPAFGVTMLEFFRWVARYYHAPLGEVIRTALPSSLATTPTVRARITPLGRSAAAMPGSDKTLQRLAASAQGTLAVSTLRRELAVSMTRLGKMEREGWLELLRETAPANDGRRRERVAKFLMQVPLPGNARRAKEVLRAIAKAGTVAVSELRADLGEVSPQLRSLQSRGAIRIEERRVFRTPQGAFLDSGEAAAADPPPLMRNQKAALEVLSEGFCEEYRGFLLHGVTGSGKTEVYLRLIADARKRARGAIVLVPEIALTPQLVGRFRARFGDRIALLHSGLSDGERLDQWEQVRDGRLSIVIGARSAIFAPVPNLGLIVVDEEHESSFKQEDQLRYHARDLALLRGRQEGITVVLGSATPSLESVHNARHGKLTLVQMKERVQARPLPDVTLVDLRRVRTIDKERTLSLPLLEALQQNLATGEQSLLFLNRRGYANFIICRQCGHIQQCPNCDISLTYHQGWRRLVCHYCDHARGIPERCPKCQSTMLQPLGVGTEKVEETLRRLLPEARLARMDRDTTRGAALGNLLRAVRRGDIDILVGTQMVAKGHDFPNVTLVGALLADQGLKFPDFRAAERTFQLLTQVAGRAGRGERPGRVIVQTFDPSHYSLRHARDHDFEHFVEDELKRRQERGYPPAVHLALVRVVANDSDTARKTSEWAARTLLSADPRRAVGTVGPSPAPIERIKGRVRWHLLVRSTERRALHASLAALRAALEQRRGGTVTVTIDVDPGSML